MDFEHFSNRLLGHCPVVVNQVRHRMEARDEILTAQITEVEAELTSLLPAELPEAEAAETSPDTNSRSKRRF